QLGDGFIEIGRNTSNLIIGTDGDGINDADEGNVFGGFANGGAAIINLYSDPRTNIVIAGNSIGQSAVGSTRFPNSCTIVDGFGDLATVRFGSDFDGVSDELERSEEHTSELQSRGHLVCRLLLEKKNSLVEK